MQLEHVVGSVQIEEELHILEQDPVQVQVQEVPHRNFEEAVEHCTLVLDREVVDMH